jgi:hypothetical protein
MPGHTEKPLDLIGRNLRDALRDVVASPLPDRLCQLLAALEAAANPPSESPVKRLH